MVYVYLKHLLLTCHIPSKLFNPESKVQSNLEVDIKYVLNE